MPISMRELEQAASQGLDAVPTKQTPAVDRKAAFQEAIAQFNEFGTRLKTNHSMKEVADHLMRVAEQAERSIMDEAEDFFDGYTIKRNLKEMKGYVSEFAKIATEYDMMQHRAAALHDDMGRILERYFRTSNESVGGYDTDDDGKDDLMAGNSEKEPVAPGATSMFTHEAIDEKDDSKLTNMVSKITNNTPGTSNDVPPKDVPPDENSDLDSQEKNDDLIQRLLTLARHRIREGDDLVKFDTLPMKKRLQVAWKVVR